MDGGHKRKPPKASNALVYLTNVKPSVECADIVPNVHQTQPHQNMRGFGLKSIKPSKSQTKSSHKLQKMCDSEKKRKKISPGHFMLL